MGIYLNPGSAMFQKSLKSKIYVDKSGLLAILNELVDTEQRYVCVSRPRRFGKSMAANMLAAYYGSSEDTSALFASLEISQCAGYRDHLNQYDVLKINMQDFLSESQSIEDMLAHLTACLIRDLKNGFPQIDFSYAKSLVSVMREVFAQTGRSFVILIDEWDCLFREYESNKEAQKQYLDFLRVWLKDKEYVGLAYMTGILPIKKEVNTEKVFNEKLKYSSSSVYLDGVKLEVTSNYLVPSLREGMVVFIGNKEGYGNTVIIEDLDGIYNWYGNIDNTSLKLYDYVDKGTLVGEVNNTLYLVFSKGDKYLNYEEYLK